MPPALPATGPVAEDPASFDLVYAVARSQLPGSLRHWGVPPEDIDDLVQDVTLIACEALPHFTPRGEPTPDLHRSLRAWLSAIGWRLAARSRVRAHRRYEVPHGDAADLVAVAGGPPTSEELAAANQRRAILAGLVRKLPPERAEVLLMHVLLGMTVPEIAKKLGLNPNTVKSRLARARADALAAIGRLDPDEQSVLKGSLLILPLLYAVDATPVRAAPRSKLVRGVSLAAGAAAMLAVGMGIGVGLRRPARHAVEEAPVIAAVDRAEPEDISTVRAVSAPAEVPARPPPATGSAGTDARSGSLAREQRWLAMAQRALLNRDAEQAQAALNAHFVEFPHGVLASQREVLRAQLRALADEHGQDAGFW